MWNYVKREFSEKSISDVKLLNTNYYSTSTEDKLHIMDLVLGNRYDIYTREIGDTMELMVHDTALCDYYDEEQDGRLNLIKFWQDIIIEKLAKS